MDDGANLVEHTTVFLPWFIFSHLLNLLCIHVCITQASICIQFLNSVSVNIEPKPLLSAENIRSRNFWVWAWLEIFQTGQSKFGCLMIDISLACVVGSTEVGTGIVGCKFSSICKFLVLNYVYELLLYWFCRVNLCADFSSWSAICISAKMISMHLGETVL